VDLKVDNISDLKVEAVCFFATSVSTYESARRFNAEDQHRRLDCRVNVDLFIG
jgi:hypothetical protein